MHARNQQVRRPVQWTPFGRFVIDAAAGVALAAGIVLAGWLPAIAQAVTR